MRHDRLLKELDTKLSESVQQVVTTLKKAQVSLNKKCKKLTSDLGKTSSLCENLEEKVKKLCQKTLTPKKKQKRKRRTRSQSEVEEPAAERSTRRMRCDHDRVLSVDEQQTENTARVLVRPPTPMVTPMNGRGWWNGPSVPQQAYVGSDVPPRRVSPTPQFMSPVYASRNFMR